MKKLQLDKTIEASRQDSNLKHEVMRIEEQIASIEKNITGYEERRARELEELSTEKNYELFFYIAGGLVLLNLIFKFNLPGLFIAFMFGGMFFVYKKYFTKEVRASRINTEIDAHIAKLQQEVAKWQEKKEELV
jgi:hypothetical protein